MVKQNPAEALYALSGNLDTALRTAIFGGTFDPVHNGHLNLCRQLLVRDLVEQVVFVPANVPPHKRSQSVTDDEHRLAMLRLALAGEPGFVVSTVELERPGLSYTIDTAAYFRELLTVPPRLVLGMDSLRDLHLWHRSRELVVEYNFIIYRRPGVAAPAFDDLAARFGREAAAKLSAAVVDGPQVDVSSSRIRSLVRAGKSVGDLLPAAVWEYIQRHALYLEPADQP